MVWVSVIILNILRFSVQCDICLYWITRMAIRKILCIYLILFYSHSLFSSRIFEITLWKQFRKHEIYSRLCDRQYFQRQIKKQTRIYRCLFNENNMNVITVRARVRVLVIVFMLDSSHVSPMMNVYWSNTINRWIYFYWK